MISWRLSLRQLAICSCKRATRMRALLRLAEAFCFLLNRFCSSFRRSRLFCRFFGLSNVRPSEHTASDLMPRSMPMADSRTGSEGFSSCKAVSTSTDAKYLPEGVMLTVTVFTVPLNLRCSTAGMPFALGMEMVSLPKSTLQCCGHWKLCLSLRLLKRGKPTAWVSRKKVLAGSAKVAYGI